MAVPLRYQTRPGPPKLAANILWSIISRRQKQVLGPGEGGRRSGVLPSAFTCSWPACPFACGYHVRLWEGLGRHQPLPTTTFHSMAQPSKFAGLPRPAMRASPTWEVKEGGGSTLWPLQSGAVSKLQETLCPEIVRHLSHCTSSWIPEFIFSVTLIRHWISLFSLGYARPTWHTYFRVLSKVHEAF